MKKKTRQRWMEPPYKSYTHARKTNETFKFPQNALNIQKKLFQFQVNGKEINFRIKLFVL